MGLPPFKKIALRIQTSEDDLPADRFSDHVNNARYFHFINLTFQRWYRDMGIRGGVPGRSAMMAHVSYDFRGEIKPPAIVECRIDVVKVGNSSLEHTIEMYDLGLDGEQPARFVGRGRSIHVWVNTATRSKLTWPADVLAKCWSTAEVSRAREDGDA
ncbi:MAG: acyl-CoA thioesterase [Hyphomicrobiales bacterium]|nr:acyl-CoA thioesterase [Hyphomicrobiales bacterium]